jgi:hypothetical protein
MNVRFSSVFVWSERHGSKGDPQSPAKGWKACLNERQWGILFEEGSRPIQELLL